MSTLKKVPGFPDYEVSSSGEIFSNKRGTRIEMQPSTSTGYKKVMLVHNGKTGNFQIHRLVAQLFIRNPKKLEIVNHIDGDKLNNDISNLEWVSRRGNGKHYSETLAPKYAAARRAKKEDDMKMRLSIMSHAHSACTSNPELFYSIYQTVMASD